MVTTTVATTEEVVDLTQETKGLRFEISWQAKRAKDTIRGLRFQVKGQKSKVKIPKKTEKTKTTKTLGGAAGSTSTHSKFSFKFCSSKLNSPCPTTQNSLRLAALPRKTEKTKVGEK